MVYEWHKMPNWVIVCNATNHLSPGPVGWLRHHTIISIVGIYPGNGNPFLHMSVEVAVKPYLIWCLLLEFKCPIHLQSFTVINSKYHTLHHQLPKNGTLRFLRMKIRRHPNKVNHPNLGIPCCCTMPMASPKVILAAAALDRETWWWWVKHAIFIHFK